MVSIFILKMHIFHSLITFSQLLDGRLPKVQQKILKEGWFCSTKFSHQTNIKKIIYVHKRKTLSNNNISINNSNINRSNSINNRNRNNCIISTLESETSQQRQ
ncbi:hypothetical protein ACTA71_008461 [Dictyostelium dimigraforme]